MNPPVSRTADRLLRAVRWYQRQMEGRPSPCRFFPSCSAYAHEAVELHGARRGSWLAARRLLRCRPFGPSGFDPVPEPSVPSVSAHSPRSCLETCFEHSSPTPRPAHDSGPPTESTG